MSDEPTLGLASLVALQGAVASHSAVAGGGVGDAEQRLGGVAAPACLVLLAVIGGLGVPGVDAEPAAQGLAHAGSPHCVVSPCWRAPATGATVLDMLGLSARG